MSQIIGRPLIKPIIYDHAFDDPERIRTIIAANAPYHWLMRDYPSEYRQADDGAFYIPWFREIWQQADAHIGERGELLHYDRFIEGARQSFVGFEIVRPEAVLVNIMAPLGPDGPHFDLPHFRGFPLHGIPTWFLMAMGRSELFERWHVNICSALAWLYRGDGGGFSYWADGPDRPPSRIESPMENRMLISDNQRMYHAIEAFGEGASLAPPQHGRDAALFADGNGGWALVDDSVTIKRYSADDLRISILWRAVMHKDAEAARVYDEGLDDITVDLATAMLIEGAKATGHDIPLPVDPLKDSDFMARLDVAFPRPKLVSRNLGELVPTA